MLNHKTVLEIYTRSSRLPFARYRSILEEEALNYTWYVIIVSTSAPTSKR